MNGIDFTEQVETPGLGARITEIGFKRYFRGLDLTGFDENVPPVPAVFMINRKEFTNRIRPTREVESITGATQTCLGVLEMLNTDLRFYRELIRHHGLEKNDPAIGMQPLTGPSK
jgi:Na+-transporting NADH:ubiquinone oxidoreductase subunit NqrC